MIDVKVTTGSPAWPWKRQTPKGSGEWGPFRFHIDDATSECDLWIVFGGLPDAITASCPANKTVFISGEPDSIGHYHRKFLRQFAYAVSGRQDVQHPNILRLHQGHPWHIDKSYDELVASELPHKTKDLCIVTSNKHFTPGHQDRLDLVRKIQDEFGMRVDVWGRGIREFDSKWDVLAQYRYSIVIENYQSPDFITEKLPDAWLAYCFPFYVGATNVSRYWPQGAWIDLNPLDITSAAKAIHQCMDNPTHYKKALPDVESARRWYLAHEQFFPNVARVCQWLLSTSEPVASKQITLRPNTRFSSAPPLLEGLSRRFLSKKSAASR